MSDVPTQASQAYDILRKPLQPAIHGEHTLGYELDNRLTAALVFFARNYPDFPFEPSAGIMGQLERLIAAETEPDRQRNLQRVLGNLRAFFKLPDLDRTEANHGQLRIFVTPDKLTAFLVATPTRGDNANIPTHNLVASLLARAKINVGIDAAAIEKALHTARELRDIVWCAPIARGQPATPEHCERVHFTAPVVDRVRLRQLPQSLATVFAGLGKPIAPGMIVGDLVDTAQGRSGLDVFGHVIPPPQPETRLDLGDDFERLPDGRLAARAAGFVVVDGTRVDLVPFYIVNNPVPGALADFAFPGAVLVLGALQGPGKVTCEDMFVLGNCEQMDIVCGGDLFIGGGIVGRRQSTIETDGGIYAAFISEATLSALGEVVATNAILNSRIVSNQSIRVASTKGMIAGGNLAALKHLAAATLGSEFGMLTETVVGKDFLTADRLKTLGERMAVHTENLRRIQELKLQMEKSRLKLERLPPQQQEIFINVLRKEQTSQDEMHSLLRRKKKLEQIVGEIVDASIQVLDHLYPPVRVQIGDAIKEIREKLQGVTLTYDKQLGIVSDGETSRKEEVPT